jgi:hypothetical protein
MIEPTSRYVGYMHKEANEKLKNTLQNAAYAKWMSTMARITFTYIVKHCKRAEIIN